MNELLTSNRRLVRDSSLLWKTHSDEFPSWLKSKVDYFFYVLVDKL